MIEVELLKNSERVQYKIVGTMGGANNAVERWRKIYGKSFKNLTIRIEDDRASSKSPFKKGQLSKRRKLNRASSKLYVIMKYAQGGVKHV